MGKVKYLALGAFASAALGASVSANAMEVNIDWWSVDYNSTNPAVADFQPPGNNQCCGSYFTNADPAVTVGVPLQVSAADPANYTEGPGGSLPWWTATNDGAITYEGRTTQSLPVAQNMFVTMGKGNTNQDGYYQTAIISSSLHVGPNGGTITFGGDDDMFLAINGNIVDQLGGIHPAGTTVTYDIGAGNYEMDVYYADRHTVAAYANLSMTGITTDVPEPATWAMMVLGFAGLGYAGFRSRKTAISIA